jgi:hypothetical protein
MLTVSQARPALLGETNSGGQASSRHPHPHSSTLTLPPNSRSTTTRIDILFFSFLFTQPIYFFLGILDRWRFKKALAVFYLRLLHLKTSFRHSFSSTIICPGFLTSSRSGSPSCFRHISTNSLVAPPLPLPCVGHMRSE